jgi:hypothetical protein
MKSEKLCEKLASLKDKESRLAVILAARKHPEKLDTVVKAVEDKLASSKFTAKTAKLLEKLSSDTQREIANALLKSTRETLHRLLDYDPLVEEYLRTAKKSKKILQKRFDMILANKTYEEESKFVHLLDKLDSLSFKLESLGLDSKAIVKAELDTIAVKQRSKESLNGLDVNNGFLKGYLDAE